MKISRKQLVAVEEAIRSAYIDALDEYFPQWSKTPPDQMDDQQKRLFDALADVERRATVNVRAVLS